MKKIFSILLIMIALVSCSKEDEKEISLTISKNEVIFSVIGGEQVIDVICNSDWECNYTGDWLLVRQQQNKIRIITNENADGNDRTATIQITCNGILMETISVLQKGTDLTIETSTITAKSSGEEVIVSVTSNTKWSIENSNEWCVGKQENNKLVIMVSRNYQMQDRTSTIIIKAGDISHNITIQQSPCQWYESFEIITVESGSFWAGAQKQSVTTENYDMDAYQIESPVHKVTINKYGIGKYEVTQKQWTAAMGKNPSLIQDENHPVENVTWEQVQEFITLLNEKTGLNYRLPTEGEWEFAAKGGNLSERYKYSGNSVLGSCGWFYSNSEASTHEVGLKNPNELGIYDMSGNVREWCNDWFEYYTSNETNNPQGPVIGNMKINRGGSWTTPAINCRNSYRHTSYLNEASQDLGFRLALTNK